MNWTGHKRPTRSELPSSPDESLHVYNRGVDRQRIFFDGSYYGLFLALVAQFCNPLNLQILAYCLMANHFQFLIHQLRPYGISLRMEQVTGEFARTTNQLRGRAGHLFQQRYGLRWIWEDDAIPIVADYIHQNPVKSKLVELPEDWEFSSCRDYFALRSGGFCAPGEVLSRLNGSKDYREHIRQVADAEALLDHRCRFPN